MVGIVGGEVGNLVAYGYAPAAVVTPLGAVGTYVCMHVYVCMYVCLYGF